MSLTAIFTRAPQRYAEVGPSLDTNQSITYRNPGISLSVFDTDREVATFTGIVSAARMIAVQDRWITSYSSASSETIPMYLTASYVDAYASISENTELQQSTEYVPEFDIVNARALINATKKVQHVSIEV